MYIKLILKHFFYKFIGWMSPKGIVANLPIFFGMLCGVAVADTNLPGNHIHNFSNNIWDKTSVDWALPVFHAHELGYQLVTIGKPKNFNFDDLKIIKISNAYYFPARVDTSTKSVQYIQWVDDGKGTSLLRDNRKTYKWYKLDEIDLQLMETYGCRRDNNVKMTGSSNLIAIKQAFYTDWDTGSVTIPIYNFQSKFAVRRLVNNILQSYSMGDYSALFIDDLSREIPGCENKDSGEEGSYRTWKDGQKDFVVQINSELKRRYLGRDLIFGNVWHPLNPGVARTYLKWFADGSLKLDHYYLEAGPQKNTSIVANGVDLLTARPAYVSQDGFIPADRVSISTSHGWYGPQVSDEQKTKYKSGIKEYLDQHYYVARVAALQGSWFGWYGGNSIDRREPSSGADLGSLIHTNDMQLLRAIPGWDNLVGLTLAERRYDSILRSYESTNSYFSPNIIFSRHYKTGEIFVVFKNLNGKIKLRQDEIIMEAWYANHYFGRTSISALPCLKQSGSDVSLTCEIGIDRGIRIVLESTKSEKSP